MKNIFGCPRCVYIGVLAALCVRGMDDSALVRHAAGQAAAGEVQFSENLIWNGFRYNYGLGSADIDGDGDIDLTAADADGNDSLYWFANDGKGNFNRRFITRDEPHRLERHMIADINRDGRPDVVIVENHFGDLKWYENPGQFSDDRLWKRTYITKGGLLGAYDVDIADFNGDGWLDAAASTWRLGNRFVWFANPGNSQPARWQAREIDVLTEDTRCMAADFDGDGRPDLLGTSAAARIVLWYQNSGPLESPTFVRHVVDLPKGVQPVHGQPVDMDRDGDMDIIMAVGGFGTEKAGGVLWYENGGMVEERIRWTNHTISQDLPRGFEAVAGDLDGDGDVDAVATGFGSGLLVWFENPGDPKGNWTRHLLKQGWQNANQVIIVDLDKDGRKDIAAIAERGSLELRWWRNQGRKTGH